MKAIATVLLSLSFLFSFQSLSAQSTDTLLLNLSSATVDAEEEFCIDVTASGFKSLAVLQFALQWDNSVVELKDIFVPSAVNDVIDVNNFGIDRVNRNAIRFSWFDGTLNTVTLPDETVLFQICFQAIQPSTQTEVSIAEQVMPVEAFTLDLTPMTVMVTGGQIEVAERIPVIQEATVTISSIKVPRGERACAEVIMGGLNNVDSIYLRLVWDESLLELEGQTEEGFLELNLNRNQLQALGLGNTDEIARLCFTAIGEIGQTSALVLEEIFARSTEADEVSFTITDGAAEIITPLRIPGSIDYSIPDVAVAPDRRFCVDVMATNFNDIAVVQHSLEWDNTLLNFKEVIINEAFDPNEFFTWWRADRNNGEIIIAWRTAIDNAVTIPSGLPLYALCFESAGIAETASTSIAFKRGKPTPERVLQNIDGVLYEMPFTYDDGEVTISLSANVNGDNYSTSARTNMLISPNPTSDVVEVTLRNESLQQLELMDGTGKALKTTTTNTLDVNDVTAGTYWLKITTSDHVYVEQLSVQ